MKTSFKMVAMLLGIGVFPVCAQAQKKVVIEDAGQFFAFKTQIGLKLFLFHKCILL